MAAFTFMNRYANDLNNGVHNWSSDVFKWRFVATANIITAATAFGSITEIAAGNGYPAGGLTVDSVSTAIAATNGAAISYDDEVFTASGGAVTLQQAVLVNETAGQAVGFSDYGSSLTLADGESVNLDVATNPITTS